MDIGEMWREELLELMAEAEKRLAELRGDHDGVPTITIIVGVSTLIGIPTMPSQVLGSRETEKLLFVGVHNNCYACARNIPETSTNAKGTGQHHHLKWRLTLSWRGFWKLERVPGILYLW
jgi:hypothetical protein